MFGFVKVNQDQEREPNQVGERGLSEQVQESEETDNLGIKRKLDELSEASESNSNEPLSKK